ncbi:methyltransferase domain-containing protein [Winogradskyella flava]|uniref:Methyltransferase domain-containing protein n=2 Tax=Winogradskyella flava TaxID=1884876 RepID=A0A842IT16_9FLAO|nr:methyltransferase domain-containing protein [Winogradskyella flava]MBC2845925.1 methyltransferase domain-containing protein [Winogradskyella flava]
MDFMKKSKLNKSYWEQRYETYQIGWDIGYPSTPLKIYVDQIEDKSLKILIPGAGNSYEVEYLWNKGFKNVYALDIAKQPLEHLSHRIPNLPTTQLLHMDFFNLNAQFDLIMEQTFFCALDPILRPNYVEKMYQLLRPQGKLVGLLFNFPLTENEPPFGGSLTEYKSLFKKRFRIKTFDESINSIEPRKGKELFFIFESI